MTVEGPAGGLERGGERGEVVGRDRLDAFLERVEDDVVVVWFDAPTAADVVALCVEAAVAKLTRA